MQRIIGICLCRPVRRRHICCIKVVFNMYQTTSGIVLRQVEYNDADLLLEVLTKDFGRLTLKARGVRKSKGTLKSACQLLCFSEFTFTERNGKAVITEAVSKEQFRELRENIELLYLGEYFAQVSELLSQQDAPDNRILSLLLNSLYALCKLKKPQLLVKAAFELRMACMAGFTPDLQGCAVCERQDAAMFDVQYGVLYCADCRPTGDGLRMPVSDGVLAAMRYIVLCEPKKLFSFSLPEEALTQLSNVTETYLSTQLEHSFFTLDFYKSLFVHFGENDV